MESLASHVEHLLRKHDCVVLPGFGAFLCNRSSARLNESGEQILPPGRLLTFNPLINRNDGLLATSIARKEQISFETAKREEAEKIAHLRGALHRDGAFQFSRLGTLSITEDGMVTFSPAELPGINGWYFGLRPVPVKKIARIESGKAILEPSRKRLSIRWQSARMYASGVAAFLALAIIVGTYFLTPVKSATPVAEASLSPAATSTAIPVALSGHGGEYVFKEKLTPVGSDTLSIALPTDTSACQPATAQSSPTVSNAATASTLPQSSAAPRFNATDSYCLIVASFATRSQAEVYIAGADAPLGILEKDNKFRVYAATGSSYQEASQQKRFVAADAWVCHR